METTLLALLEHLILAKNAPKPLKASYLLKSSGLHEVALLKLRLYLELELVNSTRVFQSQAKCAEIGRMLGGWLKSVHTLPQR